jgi:nicotinamidase-related amidase
MNDVLKEARKRGATIIHSPSDCMAAYESHPGRKRAMETPTAKNKPKDIEHWCSRISSEEKAVYPLDQSDGGEDDDPKEHAEWAAKLKEMGRNPGTPWKTQSKLIEIDEKADFISDRGEEVWNVLEARGIKNVVLVGVHLNMCVLGRPFGLRQMVKNGKNVALMRDMTDCMYNPKRWPHVDHFTGNDLMVAHVEKYVCPTITSDQLLGGETFKSKYDMRKEPAGPKTSRLPKEDWTPVAIPVRGDSDRTQPVWYRCIVRLPKEWATNNLRINVNSREPVQVWTNGQPAKVLGTTTVHAVALDSLIPDDYNLVVVRIDPVKGSGMSDAPDLVKGTTRFELKGQWQARLGNDPSWSNIPLPAKFGGATDMTFEVQ